ncbi:aminotransferase class I/II-fold pyridoxal phosphate-dependent enzyme [Microbacterium sediminicola]|uniref:Aminotransferase class I/II-fold pyridoxal phosphate-dependent enzyme n=1 Tax=Microbacterium sediminicola TaxID=415210 RepID=A0ABN2IKV4_9MICO
MNPVLARATFSAASPQAIAAELARLVNEGAIAPGERLPTVREVATELGVSPATVSAAWKALSQAGLIVSRGRAGSFVREPRREGVTPRVHGMAQHPGSPRLDLSVGTPDAALLPDMGAAFSRVSARAHTGSYHDSPVLPELGALLAEQWPSRAEAITVTDGALDAVSRVLEQVVHFGDRVAVEDPGFPYFFDLIDALGAVAVPVAVDADGIVPSSLAHALVSRPSAIVLQPRAQNPTGASMDRARAAELARLVRASRDGHRIVIVEDDHSGLIAAAPPVTLATWLPAQTVHVRSFSKSHGPDLRIAALGGPSWLIDRVVARRLLGPGWTSRALQSVLYDLLTDPVAVAVVDRARDTYRSRQLRLAEGLRRHGIQAPLADGVNITFPVAEERPALVHLAAEGIAAAGGAPFRATLEAGGATAAVSEVSAAASGPFVRLTVGLIPDDAAWVAPAIARALR